MSHPAAFFLDTCILEGQQFNFGSAAISSFVPVATKKKLKLLLPDPTAREIQRHIKDRSSEALKALDQARRKAPFLAKWKGFPPKPPDYAEWEVAHVARQEWNAFIKQFDTVELGYGGVKIETVMGWYDSLRAPFSEAKRKEFPDAFAVAILAAYAATENVQVAVVSTDKDIAAACERYANLLYFPSLQHLTELLLKGEHAIEALRAAIEKDTTSLAAAVSDAAADLDFFHTRDRYRVEDIEMTHTAISDFRIVAIGNGECTVSFDAELDFGADVSWEDWAPDEDGPYRVSDRVNATSDMSGTAKLKLKADGSGIEEVKVVDFDHSDVTVTAIPGWER